MLNLKPKVTKQASVRHISQFTQDTRLNSEYHNLSLKLSFIFLSLNSEYHNLSLKLSFIFLISGPQEYISTLYYPCYNGMGVSPLQVHWSQKKNADFRNKKNNTKKALKVPNSDLIFLTLLKLYIDVMKPFLRI